MRNSCSRSWDFFCYENLHLNLSIMRSEDIMSIWVLELKIFRLLTIEFFYCSTDIIIKIWSYHESPDFSDSIIRLDFQILREYFRLFFYSVMIYIFLFSSRYKTYIIRVKICDIFISASFRSKCFFLEWRLLSSSIFVITRL